MAKSNLSDARKKSGLTQQELADAIGAHWTTISRLETGKLPMSFDWARKLALVLRRPWTDLLDAGVDPLSIFVGGQITDFGRNADGFVQDDGSLLTLPATGRGAWFLIGDQTFFPQFRKGDLVHFRSVPLSEIDSVLGRFVMAVSTKVEPYEFFGTFARGLHPDRYCVRTNSAPDSSDFEPQIVAAADLVYLAPQLPPSFSPKIIKEPHKVSYKDAKL